MRLLPCLSVALATLISLTGAASQDLPIAACATTPDLGALLTEIGGSDVTVTVFTRGPEDPHYLEARPSMVKALHEADLFVLIGLDLEQGWAPALWTSARNPRVAPGGTGYVDASTAIVPRGVPATPVDRSLGDVHALGSPHYLLDPLNGLAVADLLRQRLTALKPSHAAQFQERFTAFRTRLAVALVGREIADRYPIEKLGQLADRGKLEEFLRSRDELGRLGGWLQRVARFRGTGVVADHDLWSYFGARFGISVLGYLEPKPGIAPTTRHLEQLVRTMKERQVKVILAAPYFNPRHARVVAESSGAKIALMVHQVGAASDASQYLDMIEHNVAAVCTALAEAP